MADPDTPTRPTFILLLVLFVFTVTALGYLASRHRSEYVTLTINNEWQIYLMGEDKVDSVKFHVGRFTEVRHNSRHLWLRGEGEIHWLKNVIQVHKGGVYLNNKLFSPFYREKQVNIVFMRNGKAHKGKPTSHTGS